MLHNWKCRLAYLHLFKVRLAACVVSSKAVVLGAGLMRVTAVLSQVRSLMCAWCAVKHSVRAPIWSPTAGNTAATSPSAAHTALSASRGDWTYSATYRHTCRTTAHCIMGPERDQLHLKHLGWLNVQGSWRLCFTQKSSLYVYERCLHQNKCLLMYIYLDCTQCIVRSVNRLHITVDLLLQVLWLAAHGCDVIIMERLFQKIYKGTIIPLCTS